VLHDNGWTVAGLPPYGADGMHVRVRRDKDGRRVITDLYVHGDELTAETLRGISMPRLAARFNSPGQADPGEGPDDDLTVAELRRRAGLRAERERDKRKYVKRAALSRPDGSDPETFYRLVASAYNQYAQEVRAPAKAIAEEAGVPVSTVHRWVREARRRGFMPPGRKGRAV
jgi:hypothetical protein